MPLSNSLVTLLLLTFSNTHALKMEHFQSVSIPKDTFISSIQFSNVKNYIQCSGYALQRHTNDSLNHFAFMYNPITLECDVGIAMTSTSFMNEPHDKVYVTIHALKNIVKPDSVIAMLGGLGVNIWNIVLKNKTKCTTHGLPAYPLPAAMRYAIALDEENRIVYTCGGGTAASPIDTCFKLNIGIANQPWTWEPMASDQALVNHNLFVYQSYLYVITGSTQIRQYNPKSDVWKDVANFPECVDCQIAAVVRFSTNVFIIGGKLPSGNVKLNTVYHYDLTSITTSPLLIGTMPGSMVSQTCTVVCLPQHGGLGILCTGGLDDIDPATFPTYFMPLTKDEAGNWKPWVQQLGVRPVIKMNRALLIHFGSSLVFTAGATQSQRWFEFNKQTLTLEEYLVGLEYATEKFYQPIAMPREFIPGCGTY